MLKRLQVLVDEAELQEIRKAAEARGMTVAAWVRNAIREERRREPSTSPAHKLAVIREAAKHESPTADVAQMLHEIECGFLAGEP